MTTEQMDWLDDERAGRHKAEVPTVSADGKLLNWRGQNYVPQTPVEHVEGEPTGVDDPENVIDAMLGILGFEADTDPLYAAQKRMSQLGLSKAMHVDPAEYVTQAEEPVEHRLRRSWLNGFREGVDRAAQSIDGWGRWDG